MTKKMYDTLGPQLAEAFIKRRKELKITTKEAADLLNITVGEYIKIEHPPAGGPYCKSEYMYRAMDDMGLDLLKLPDNENKGIKFTIKGDE